jgi:hypothetical protein
VADLQLVQCADDVLRRHGKRDGGRVDHGAKATRPGTAVALWSGA